METIIEKIRKQIQNERVELSTRELLLCLLDLPIKFLSIHPYYNYRKIYENYQSWRREDRHRYYKMLYRLKRKELIIFDHEEGLKAGQLPKLTEKGKEKAQQYAVQELQPLQPKNWDRKWRLIIFDVPEKKKKAREFMRKELKRMNFCQLQKSVFIYPFQCKDEIEFIRLVSGLSKYELCYLRVDNFDFSPKILDHFIRAGLINPKEINK